jgi:hypothetical protein
MTRIVMNLWSITVVIQVNVSVVNVIDYHHDDDLEEQVNHCVVDDHD